MNLPDSLGELRQVSFTYKASVFLSKTQIGIVMRFPRGIVWTDSLMKWFFHMGLETIMFEACWVLKPLPENHNVPWCVTGSRKSDNQKSLTNFPLLSFTVTFVTI